MKEPGDLFHRFIDSFGTLTAASRRWQDSDCAASGLKWKKNLCPWILRWIWGLKNILTRNIWLSLVGSWEFSVQPWYFTLTVDNRGTDNGSIRAESGKKPHRKEATHTWKKVRLFNWEFVLKQCTRVLDILIEFSPHFVSVLATSDRSQSASTYSSPIYELNLKPFKHWIVSLNNLRFVLSWFISMLHCYSYFNNFGLLRNLQSERMIPLAPSFCYFPMQLVPTCKQY